jgi:hypothetical protein
MKEISRHKSTDVLAGYVRDAELFQQHASVGMYFRGRDGGTALALWADLGLPLDSLPRFGVEKIRTWVVARPHGAVLRPAGHSR